MPYSNIVNVDISLQTSALSRAGFGTPIFTTAHRYFNERVRAYTSLEAVTNDFPTDSNAYKALQSYFSQSPSPATVKVGRIEADATITPVNVDPGNSTHSFTIGVNDVDETTLSVSYTTVALDTEEEVVDGWVSAITGDPDISAKVTAIKQGTASSAVLQLTPVDPTTDNFFIDDLVEADEAFTKTETASEVISSVSDEDDDWYFYTTEDHSETWVLETAAAIEPLQKLYFFSSQETGSLATLADPATDTIGKVFEQNYLRTVAFWHQDADTDFVEAAFVGYNAPFDAGTVTWANLQLAGVSVARDPDTGLKLSTTQKSNLFDRNANTTEIVAGLTIIREGKVVKGNFIDDVRGSDDLDVTMTVNVQRLLTQQQGSKLPYTDQGITQINSVMQSTLQRFVDRGFLESYTVDTPSRASLSANQIASRDYDVATFEGIIAGAIHTVRVVGTLRV